MKVSELKHHLLAGSSFGNVSALLYHNGFRVGIEYLPRLFYVLLATFMLIPFRLIENLLYADAIKKTVIQKDPIFIIGHWRSGTTLLHNLLSQDDQFTFPDTYQCFLPGVFLTGKSFLKSIHRRTLPVVRPMDNVAMDPDFPQEEEFAMSSLTCHSYYQSIFFPSRMPGLFQSFALMKSPCLKQWRQQYVSFLKKVSYAKGGKQLLLKNPVNTVRLTHLLKLFPNARFIYLYRNKEEVLRSTYKLYHDLFRINSFQNITSTVLRENILTIYTETLGAYQSQKHNIDERNLIEISYDDLIQDPLGVARKIYQHLDLRGFEQASAFLQAYISKQSTYVCNSYHQTTPWG